MPKIPEYENKLFPDPGPMAKAASSAESTAYYRGRLIDKGWNDLGQGVQAAYSYLTKEDTEAQKRAEQEDVAKLTNGVAVANAKLTVDWQTKLAGYDPNGEEDAVSSFMDSDFNKTFDEFKPTTQKGRDYLEKAKTAQWAHFYVKTNTDVANVKGANAVEMANGIYTQYSNSIVADPIGWKGIIAQSEQAVEALDNAHGFGPEKKSELNKKWNHDYAELAAKQMVHDDPELGSEAIQNGDFDQFLKGDEKLAILIDADQRAKTIHSQQLTSDKAEHVKAVQQAQSGLVELQQNGMKMQPDGTFLVDPDYPQQLDAYLEAHKDTLTPAEGRAARTFASRAAHRKREDVTLHNDKATDTMLFDKLEHHTLTEAELDDAHNKDLITSDTWKKYKKQMLTPTAEMKAEKAARGWLLGLEKTITGTFQGSEFGTPTAMEFREYAIGQFQKAMEEGKSKADWQSDMQREAPNWFYGHEHAKTTIDKHVQEQIEKGANVDPSEKQRKPGESWDDLFKRRGLN